MLDMKMIVINGKPVLIKYNTETNSYQVLHDNKTYDSIDEFARKVFGKDMVEQMPMPLNIHTLEQNLNAIAKY